MLGFQQWQLISWCERTSFIYCMSISFKRCHWELDSSQPAPRAPGASTWEVPESARTANEESHPQTLVLSPNRFVYMYNCVHVYIYISLSVQTCPCWADFARNPYRPCHMWAASVAGGNQREPNPFTKDPILETNDSP